MYFCPLQSQHLWLLGCVVLIILEQQIGPIERPDRDDALLRLFIREVDELQN